MYQGSELGSLRYDSGMIRGMIRKRIFFWIQEALLLESLFPTINLLRLLLNGCNGSTCQTTLDRTWIWRMWRFKCTSMIYIRRPAGVSSGCSSHVPLAQLRLGLCSSSTDFWLVASQPATAGVILLISLISNTASSQPRSQPAATSQPYSQPPNQQQQLSQPPSQPASQPPRASQLRDNDETLCAWRRFATPWRYMWR